MGNGERTTPDMSEGPEENPIGSAAVGALEVAGLALQLRAIARSPRLSEFQRRKGTAALLQKMEPVLNRHDASAWRLLSVICGIASDVSAMQEAASVDDQDSFRRASAAIEAGVEQWESMTIESAFILHTTVIEDLISHLESLPEP